MGSMIEKLSTSGAKNINPGWNIRWDGHYSKLVIVKFRCDGLDAWTINTRWISNLRWRWKCWRRGWDKTGRPRNG